MILTPLQQLPKNGENWGKFIVAKGFKKLHKVQNIAQSGHTNRDLHGKKTMKHIYCPEAILNAFIEKLN